MCEVWRGYCTDDWVFDECPSAAEDTRQCEVGGIFIPSEGLYTAAYVRQLRVVCAHTCDVANDVTYDAFDYDAVADSNFMHDLVNGLRIDLTKYRRGTDQKHFQFMVSLYDRSWPLE